MPYKIIADEVEHALRRLMESGSVDKRQEKVVDGSLGAGAYDRMKEIAAEEAQEIVRKLEENHWRLEKIAVAKADADADAEARAEADQNAPRS